MTRGGTDVVTRAEVKSLLPDQSSRHRAA